MAIKWFRSKYPGVRYKEHETRCHGVGNKPDRYYIIYYKLDGKSQNEAIGWASKGASEQKANIELAKLQENHRRGSGYRTLKERRDVAAAERYEQEEQNRKDVSASLHLSTIFYTDYLPHIQENRRGFKSWKRDEGLFRLWIEPVIGGKSLRDITPFDLEKIKQAMTKAGRAARSIEYALAIVRQVFNFAEAHDLYIGKNPAGPAGRVKRPVVDNRRERYLSRQEAIDLLAEISTRSEMVHDIAMLSIYTGMRAGEIFSLTWADVDFEREMLFLKDTKSNKNRPAFMTSGVKAMLQNKIQGAPSELVFPGRNGKKIVQISDAYTRAVDKLGLNDGITDRRQRVTFHTLRHTFASWQVEQGTDIYTVQELLGHSDLKLTARYAHIGENSLRTAVQRLEATG